MNATTIAATAAGLVDGPRDATHGNKRDNFARTVMLWNAWLHTRFPGCGVTLEPTDFGAMMVLLKLARTQIGTLNMDDYIDACGYAACMGECASEGNE